MARKATNSWKDNANEIYPSKIYFVDNGYELFGPYSRRPTQVLKKEEGKLIEFNLEEKDDSISYIYFRK